MEKFYEEAERAGICIAKKKKLPAFPTEEDFLSTIEELLQTRKRNYRGKIDVVVLFCIQRDNRGLVRAANKVLRKGERIFWLASNSWGDREQVTKEAEDAAEGAITINFIEGDVSRFRKHLLNLKPTNNKYGPWFEEFYQETLKCRLPNSPIPLAYQRECAQNESLPKDLEVAPVRVVMNAVYAMAHALHNMQKELCFGKRNLCLKMKNLKGQQVLKYLKNVFFPDTALNSNVTFNPNGDVEGIYNILTFQNIKGRFRHVVIGNWSGALNKDGTIQGHIYVDKHKISWSGGNLKTPESYCSKNCPLNQITVTESMNARCCWRCESCSLREVIRNNTCSPCSLGSVPDDSLTACVILPVVYPSWTDVPAQILTVLVSVGITSCIGTAVFYVAHRHHRVIKASGRELSAILFMGIISCFSAAMLHFVMPTNTVCGLRRFADGVSMTMCYAPLLLQTYRIYRIFKSAQKSVLRPSFVSPRSQTFFALCIISVQCLLTMTWVVSQPPMAVKSYIYQDRVILGCNTEDFSIAINLSYNVALMLLSTVIAYKTRNFPRNFNEAKYIGITMYLSCSVWIAFLSCYLNAQDSIWKSYFLCGSLFLIGTITLLGLPVPKIFLVHFAKNQTIANVAQTANSRRGEEHCLDPPSGFHFDDSQNATSSFYCHV